MLRARMLWMLITVLLGIPILAVATTFESDTTALLAISKRWSGVDHLQWHGDPCGNAWRGVTCDASQNVNVTKLVLNGFNLSGRLLPSIGGLASLQTLDLSFNPQFTGPLPKELGNLHNLEFLNLQGCGFSGSIPPELGQLKKLFFLALNMNSLSGTIPGELGGLSNCTWFDLAENGISGPLPISSNNPSNLGLDNLTMAFHFHLNNNSLNGSFPKEITMLPNLIHLLLDSNQFSGEIPEEIGNFSSLTILRLDNNQFSGPLPATISKITTLTELHARNNKLSGMFPDLGESSGLMLLSIGQNSFDPQPLPSFLPSLNKVQTIEIDSCNFAGPISNQLFSLPSLESVSLQRNKLNGSVNFGDASSSLSEVDLDDNLIVSVALSANPFALSLSGNPACTDPRESLSSQVCQSKAAQVWETSSSCVLTCPSGKTVNPIACTCVYALLTTFQFTAPTFSTINQSRIDELREILADGLNITTSQVWAGKAAFTESHRLVVDVNFFPATGDTLSLQSSSYYIIQISTHRISKLDYFGPCSLTSVVPPPPKLAGKSSGFATAAAAGIAVAAVVAVFAVGLGLYAWKQKRRAEKAEVTSNPFASWGSRQKDSGTAPQLKGARFFSFAELKKATKNFSSSNEIGYGGYGKVYRGTLLAGEEVAIKRAQEGSLQGGAEFKTEIELLSRVHHRNLVGLVGFCYEQGEQMLVYEYMSRGTIRQHLAGHSQALNWRKRLEIAVGAARGIAYLHDLADPPIIHRDIKSTNILLDDKYVAKVADFGLSKLAANLDGKGHVSTQVKGTLGYLDPEYYMTQQLTEKSDVYSFGVVLLELVTARQAIENNRYIVREVRNALDRGGFSQLAQLLDPGLTDYPRKDVERFVELALSCVEESAEKRPAMSGVVRELEVLLSKISSSGFSKDNLSSSNSNAAAAFVDVHGGDIDTSKFQYSGGFPPSPQPK